MIETKKEKFQNLGNKKCISKFQKLKKNTSPNLRTVIKP